MENEDLNLPAEDTTAPVEAPVERRGKYDDSRQKLYEKADRAREETEEFPLYTPEREKFIYGKNVETRADREARRAGQDNGDDDIDAQIDQQQPVRRKLKVNGRELDLTEEEIIAEAQKSLAAGDILNQAKGARAEAMNYLQTLRRAQEEADASRPQQRDAAPQAPQQATIPDDDDLDSLIDGIQTGDLETARQSMEKYGERIKRQVLQQVGNVDERIDATIRVREQQQATKQRFDEALSSFQQEYPEFLNSRAVQMALATEITQTMRNNLEHHGMYLDVNEPPERVSLAYRQLQDNGAAVPDFGTLMRTSATSLRQQFGMPDRVQTPPRNEPPIQTDRVDRKRQMGQQPRRATVNPSTNTQEQDITTTRRQAIAEMRAARGKH